jgi:hypothetical protein
MSGHNKLGSLILGDFKIGVQTRTMEIFIIDNELCVITISVSVCHILNISCVSGLYISPT